MSVVPIIPLRRVDDLIERLEDVRRCADACGFGTLAYIVETALIEARIHQKQLADERSSLEAKANDRWRPEV